jgi:hypothetical protein
LIPKVVGSVGGEFDRRDVIAGIGVNLGAKVSWHQLVNPQVCVHLLAALLLCSFNLTAARVGTTTAASVALLLAYHPAKL